MSYRYNRGRGRGGGYNSNYRGGGRGNRRYNNRYRGGGRYSRGRGNYNYDYREDDGRRRQEHESVVKQRKFKERYLLHNYKQLMHNLGQLAEDNEINVLMITQRPSMAQKLKNLLSPGKATDLEGIYKSCPIFAFETKFLGFTGNIKITSVDERMYNIGFKDTVDLETVDPKTLFTEETIKEPVSKLLCKHIQLAARKADVLVLWTDMSLEGENVCFEIIDNVKPKLSEPAEDYILRAKYKSLSPDDIKNIPMGENDDSKDSNYNLIYRPNEYDSLSLDAKNTIDLKIENAFTLLQTRRLLSRYPTLEATTTRLVYEPCLMGALSLVVDRYIKVKQTTQAEKFYTLSVLIKEARKSFNTLELEWRRGKLFDKSCAIAVFEEIKQEKYATVIEVNETEHVVERPLALNTVTLVQHSSKLLGVNATETMKILNKLYNDGYITNYKTQSTGYGKDFDYNKVLAIHQLHSEWGKYVVKLIDKAEFPVSKGEEIGDLSPIIPIKSAEKGTLSNNEWKVYSHIVKMFLATSSKNAHYIQKEVVFQIDQELFTIKAPKYTQRGFLEIVPWMNTISEHELTKSFKIGEEYFIDTKKVIDGKTDLPFYMTEHELITSMKNYKIGGNFKIPQYIKSLIDNGYVTVEKKNNRTVMPTLLGIGLVNAYRAVDEELVNPETAAKIESSCSKIATNELDSVKVVNHTLRTFKSKYEHFDEHFDKFETVFRQQVIEKTVEYKEAKREEKKNAKDGKKKDDKKGPLEPAELQKEDLKSYEHCTVYEEHKEKLKKKFPDLQCRNCEGGAYKKAPDRIAMNNYVTLRCVKCKNTIKGFKDHERFEITKTCCEECGSANVCLHYSVKESPFAFFANKHSGCIYCDNQVRNLIEWPENTNFDKPEIKQSEPVIQKKQSKKEKVNESAPVIVISKKKRR